MRSKGMRFWGALGCAWGVVQALAHMCTRLKKIGEKWRFFRKSDYCVPGGCNTLSERADFKILSSCQFSVADVFLDLIRPLDRIL